MNDHFNFFLTDNQWESMSDLQVSFDILIFPSDFAKNILSKSESWFMDDTFKCRS